MLKLILINFYILLALNGYAQSIDTIAVHKEIFHASKIERTFPDSAEIIYKKILKLDLATDNGYSKAAAFSGLGGIYLNRKGDFRLALDNYFNCLKIHEEQKDSQNIIKTYTNISLILVNQRRYDEALVYMKKSLAYAKNHNKTELLVANAIPAADSYCGLEKSDSAILVLKPLADNPPKDINKKDLGLIYNNLGNTYFNLADDTQETKYLINTVFYAEKGRDIFMEMPKEKVFEAYSLGLLGAAYMKLGDLGKAEENYLVANTIYKTVGTLNDLELIYNEMTQLYIRMGKTEKAIIFFTKHDSIFSVLFNKENQNSLSKMKTQFETEKKEKENELLHAQNEQQKTITYFIITGLVLSLLLAVFIFRGLRQQRAANKIITAQKLEVESQKNIVEEQKHLVEEKQKEILDSITYARRIQRSLLPTEKYIERKLKNKS